MGVFNRSFVSLLALGWCAALAAGGYLVWDQSRDIHVDSSIMALNFDLIFNTQAEQILATLVIAALAIPALMILALEMTPSFGGNHVSRSDRKRDESFGALQAENDVLKKQLNDERSRRRDVEKDVNRERDLVNAEARRNANVVRDTATKPVRVDSQDAQVSRRRGWHLLPRRS